MSEKLLNLNQGTLYPALVRLEQYGWIAGEWGRTENNREAKFYAITKAGVKALGEETARWRQMMGLVERLLNEDGELRGCVPAGGCVVSELYKVLCNRPSEEENRHRWQSTTH